MDEDASMPDGDLDDEKSDSKDGSDAETAVESDDESADSLEDEALIEDGDLEVDNSVPVDGDAAETPFDDQEWLAGINCGTTPPEGVALAASPPPYSGGTCPELVGGRNTISSGGETREFILVLPADPQEGEHYPVLVMWHWLKGGANSFLEQGEVQQAVDEQRFVAIIPEGLNDIDFFGLIQLPWPFLNFLPWSRMEMEFTFFEDMLSCVSEQFNINKECVSTVGVSAGGLFAVQLAMHRSQYLSSVLSLSGGIGSTVLSNNFVYTWVSPVHKLPAIVLWGGPLDSCILLNFQSASQAFENNLTAEGHFLIECIHNCRHGEPPVDPPPGLSKYYTLWDFFLKHPYWLPDGLSPYSPGGLPPDYIPWCGIGQGSAVIRSGADCPEAGCPI